jgi:hypothetical protein
MALTVEEKLSGLEQLQYWPEYTEQQRVFLQEMARNDNNLVGAYKIAYPHVKLKAVIFSAHGLIQTIAMKDALEFLGYKKEKKEIVSKKEALELLSQHLRRTALEPETLVKLLGVYSKLSGWEKKDEEPDEAMSLDKLVAAVEQKRKHGKEN